MKNDDERIRTNTNKEKSRETRTPSESISVNGRRPTPVFDWDARSLGKNVWLRTGTGEFKNRYFEQEED
jgi:NADH:ubiquinone oxidoreductase subunit